MRIWCISRVYHSKFYQLQTTIHRDTKNRIARRANAVIALHRDFKMKFNKHRVVVAMAVQSNTQALVRSSLEAVHHSNSAVGDRHRS